MLHCLHCAEPVGPNDPYTCVQTHPGGTRNFLHIECAMRMVIGGLNHLRGECPCCGGIEPPDPADVSRRDAARAAAMFYALQNKLVTPTTQPLSQSRSEWLRKRKQTHH